MQAAEVWQEYEAPKPHCRSNEVTLASTPHFKKLATLMMEAPCGGSCCDGNPADANAGKGLFERP